MIVVRVELWSAVTGAKTELARMHIANQGTGTATLGDYEGKTFRGRDAAALDKEIVSHSATLEKFPRTAKHVWNLVARMLTAMGYA
jgi:hypothetical protein